MTPRRIVSILFAAALFAAVCAAQPLDGITHVALRVPNLERSLAFYRALGFEQAFEFRDNNQVVVAFLKVNDHQFIELYPGGASEWMHVCYETGDIEALRAEYVRRGLSPSEVDKARAGNLLFHLNDPENHVVEFLQYLPGSLHSADRGKHLGPRRISARLMRVAVPARDPRAQREFFTSRLGLGQEIDAASGVRLVFSTDDPARVSAELTARGLKPAGNKTSVSIADPDGNILYFATNPPWTAVADRLITTPVEGYVFNWGEGVQMMGLMRAAAATHNTRYTDYVERWARYYEPRPVEELLNIGAAAANPKRPGYCGHWSPGSAILYLYQERQQPEHLKLARAIVDFIRNGAERSPEGALGHWQGSHQLWVDTLYMACPLEAALGRMEKRPELIADAANQIVQHAKPLQDSRTGLIYHMWDWKEGTHSEGYWGRGNGWVLMSLADTMEVMRPTDPQYAALKDIALQLWKGLQTTQDPEGLWHTVLDDHTTYAECSATSMFVYGLLKLNRLGVLPATVREPARKAWRTVNDRYVRDGVVVGVSAGTDPRGVDAYRAKAVGTQTWGTGAYLLAASELARR